MPPSTTSGARRRRRARRDLAGRLGQPHRDARGRCGVRQTGIIDVLHEACGADMRMLQRLLRAQHRSGGYHRLAERIDRFLRGPLGAPACHPFADDRSVVATLEIVGETRILQPVILLTHQFGPADEQRVSRDLAQHPAVLGAVDVGGRRGLAEVA